MIATLFAALLVLNLSSDEKKIERPIEPGYAVSDPQFLRSMGSLLGPPLLGGNRVTSLQNGEEIFPAMLAAIRSEGVPFPLGRAVEDGGRDL